VLIQQQLSVPVSAVAAWPLLADIPSVAECVPGAEQVEQTEPDLYRGVMAVKVGPLGFKMAGTVRVLSRDDAQQCLVLKVNAEDRRLGSAAEATVTVRLEPTEPSASLLRVEADTTVRGKLAQFGQAMVKLAADDVLKRFAACLSERLTAKQAAGA
jgi:carbon monoxide dehydrogenase subunit G